MRFSVRRLSLVLASVALIFFGSCDKHHLGELPEEQKEHPDPVQEAKALPVSEKTESSPAAETTPTPAEFFPQASPR